MRMGGFLTIPLSLAFIADFPAISILYFAQPTRVGYLQHEALYDAA